MKTYRRPQRPLLLLAVLLLLGLAATPIASATDYTWSGEGSSSANTWSNGANWVGGVAPAALSSIGTLDLPSLPAITCPNFTPTTAGYVSSNDLSGLGIEHLQIDNLFIGCSYEITGQGITLGSGGLSAAPTDTYGGSAQLLLPITLSASQTWTLTGPVGGSEPDIGGNITAEALSGSTANLTVNLSNGSGLYLKGDSEVGNVTVKTGNAEGGSINLLGEPGHVAGLNASDGHSLTLEDVDLQEKHGAVGALVSVGSTLNVGWPFETDPGTLSTTSASFDAASDLEFEIASAGTTVGSDYAQLSSTGDVSLGNAQLDVSETLGNGECPNLPVGQQYTLISATGNLSGQFSNAPNGGTILDEGICNNSYRIDYHETSPIQTVTATVVAYPLPVKLSPPTISGTATEGQTLTETHGQWTNNPTSYSYAWTRCTTEGYTCQYIPGATSQTYTLTPADIGSTLRVQETARNSEGSSPRQVGVSAPTAVVQPKPPTSEPEPGRGTTTETTTPPPTTSTSSTATTQTPPPLVVGPRDPPVEVGSVSSAQIVALLGQELVPSGKLAKIGALLKNNGLTMSFKALEAGTATVQWYMVPSGAKLAKAKPVLVASGKLVFAGAGTGKLRLRLTAQGKKLLKRSQRVRLVVRGDFVPVGGGAGGRATESVGVGR